MEQKDLTGYKFAYGRETEYQVLSGYEGAEVICEEYGKDEPLLFCCNAFIVDGKLKNSYCVSYTVTKEEFFAAIEGLSEELKRNADTIAAALRKKYYKIPTVFLKLVGEAYLKGAK